FFFQAEDGIRDFHVTGVQTCALPIYKAVNRLYLRFLKEFQLNRFPGPLPFRVSAEALNKLDRAVRSIKIKNPRAARMLELVNKRSEERRVGKECRYRRRPEQ